MGTKVKRSQFKTFLNTGTIQSPVWSLIAGGVSTGKIAYNPKTTEETYIDADSATIAVDSYAPVLAFEGTAITGNAVFDYLDILRKARSILSSAETEICNVWLYMAPYGYLYQAEKQSVGIQIDDFGGDGGAVTKINYTINFLGTPVSGDFDIDAVEFIETPADVKLATLTIGTSKLSPPFRPDIYHYRLATTVSPQALSSTTALGATIVQAVDAAPVINGAGATFDTGLNVVTITVTKVVNEVVYTVDVTKTVAP